MKSKVNITEYVFRGTTIDYPGGTSSQKLGYTCTTRNPIKAALFVLECARTFPEKAVVYIAKINNLAHLKPVSNVLKKYEEELTWPVPPMHFISLTERYIPVKALVKILSDKGIKIDGNVSLDTLTRACKESPKMTRLNVKKLVKEIEL